MEFIDNEAITRILHSMLEELNVLQIKVGALETLLLKDPDARQRYTRLVTEQAEALIRERGSRGSDPPAGAPPADKPE